ncbi:putative serine racemase [Paramyrothecium foliicola]|nr:putative serine racemase [Paramyrothecium foliicola]
MANISTCPPLTRDSVIEAHKLIQPYIHLTPVMTSSFLNDLASSPRDPVTLRNGADGRKPAIPVLRLWFKCENFQRVGAFKARGAFHAIERLKLEPGWAENGGREKGVATHSSGNHAQALALAAKVNNIPAHIVMPSITIPNKVAATKGYGANVIFSTLTDRLAVAERVVAETGARLVPPYDHPDIILGQGTMGLELQQQVKGLNAIMAPCSGGGMLSGIALSCEDTGIKVFGAEPEFEGADDAKRGMEQGERITYVNSMSIADGLRSYLGVHPWSILYERKLVNGMYAVSEEEIKVAMRLILERMKLVVEPSAAVPLAVVLFDEDFRSMVEQEAGEAGWDLGIVLSGGNVAADGLANLFTV